LSLWALVAAVLLFVLLGLLGSRFAGVLVSPADGVLYRGVLYILAGTVLLHLVLTLLDLVEIPWSLLLLAGIGLLIAIAAHRFLPRSSGARLPMELGWGDGLALFALAVFTVFALTGWIAMPDFLYHWGFKGHRFYLAHGVDYPFLTRSWNWMTHPDYPNLVPETFAVTAMLARSFDLPALMLQTAVLFALLLAAVREGLRQGGADRFTQQAGLALVALITAAFGIGYIMAGAADWNLSLALAAALPPLLRPPGRTGGLQIGDFQIGLIAAFATASKVEGVPLAAFLVAVQILRRIPTERRFDLGGALRTGLLPAMVILPWLIRTVHLHLFQAFNSGAFDLARAGVIFRAVAEVLWVPAWHGLLPAMFLAPLLLLSRRTRAFAAVAFLELLFYFYVYFTSDVKDFRYYVFSNFPRLGFQLIPACLAAALVAWAVAKEKRPVESPPPAARSDETASLNAAG
jgi:hypothetical protein